MAQGRIRKGVEKSINSAVKQGFLDVETHAATKKNGETKKTTTEKLKSKFKNYGGK